MKGGGVTPVAGPVVEGGASTVVASFRAGPVGVAALPAGPGAASVRVPVSLAPVTPVVRVRGGPVGPAPVRGLATIKARASEDPAHEGLAHRAPALSAEEARAEVAKGATQRGARHEAAIAPTN